LKLTNYIAPHQAKGIKGNLPPLPHNASYLTVAEFCLERYQIDIEEYAKIISEKEARPAAAIFDFELAIFAFSQIYLRFRKFICIFVNFSLVGPLRRKRKCGKFGIVNVTGVVSAKFT